MTLSARPDSYKLASVQYQPLHVQTLWDILQVAKNQTQNSSSHQPSENIHQKVQLSFFPLCLDTTISVYKKSKPNSH